MKVDSGIAAPLGHPMTTPSPAYVAMSPRRVRAMVLRHWYLLSSSWPRVLDLIYWPAVQMLMWGFLQMYVSQNSGFFAQATGVFIGAVMLWDVLFRGQLGFSISFLEEMYARNLGNLMMTPLRPAELVAALMIQSIIRLAIGMVPVSLLAIAFFGFNLWGMGLALAVFFLNLLLTSWAVGILVSGILLRHGLGAENMAWSFMFLMLPFTCVYYPVAVLPHWLQVFAWMLPPTYVFEGMRALLIQHQFRADLMIQAFAVNAVLFAAGVAGFLWFLKTARREGTLLQGGD
jgi:ABC-2 type transport system permease protein